VSEPLVVGKTLSITRAPVPGAGALALIAMAEAALTKEKRARSCMVCFAM